jgi:hypothetical protein
MKHNNKEMKELIAMTPRPPKNTSIFILSSKKGGRSSLLLFIFGDDWMDVIYIFGDVDGDGNELVNVSTRKDIVNRINVLFVFWWW